jgi:hypothetical protein
MKMLAASPPLLMAKYWNQFLYNVLGKSFSFRGASTNDHLAGTLTKLHLCRLT